MKRRDFLKTMAGTVGGLAAAQVLGARGLVVEAKAPESAAAPTIPYLVLNNGMRMPQFGFGTWTLAENTRASVRAAAEAGYRLFDTAQGYGNEADVWQGIRDSGLSREEVFITTKISPDAMRHPPQGHSLDESLEKLGGSYIDLLLIHWPVADYLRETWQVMEGYVRSGKVRALGISNFNPHHIDDLLRYAEIKPVLNQIEIHPYLTQEANIAATKAYGIDVECWSPLSQGKVMNEPVITAIAKKYGKTNAQVTLRWEMQQGLIVIPRSKNPVHIRENLGSFDFTLAAEDMAAISALNRNERCNPKNDPDNFPW